MPNDELPPVPDLSTWSYDATPMHERCSLKQRKAKLTAEGETLLDFCKRSTLSAFEKIGDVAKARNEWWPRMMAQMLERVELAPTTTPEVVAVDKDAREAEEAARRNFLKTVLASPRIILSPADNICSYTRVGSRTGCDH